MARRSIIARFTPKNQELYDKLLKIVLSASEVAWKDEPKTLRYSVTIPVDKDTAAERSIYVIEEYADDAGLEIHSQQSAVQDLIKEIQSGALTDPPLLIMLGFDHDFGFTKPEVKQASELFIGVTELFYKPGTGAKALRSLKKGISAAGERESGTLSLALYPDPGDADKLRIIGVHESQDYWINVHGKSEEVQEFQATTKDIVDGVKVHMLKTVGGFLYKEEA